MLEEKMAYQNRIPLKDFQRFFKNTLKEKISSLVMQNVKWYYRFPLPLT